MQITESVIQGINCILDANISDASEKKPSLANSSSLILKAVEKQILQTLEEHGKFKSIKPNIAVKGVTVNQTQSEDGVDFALTHTDAGFSSDANNIGQNISIKLPNDVLNEDSGKSPNVLTEATSYDLCSVEICTLNFYPQIMNTCMFY